jgi:short subunit dehydrogenase-like uncharacterized protein
MSDDIWVLGATGRSGRVIAALLHKASVPLVLAGRDRDRLAATAAEIGGDPRLVVGSLEQVLTEVTRQAPAVVVNTVGPFTTTAAQVARACPAGTHYVDIANEYPAVEAILALDRRAQAAGQTLVPGAGFGVLATESVALRVCADRPPAKRIRVDAMGAVASEDGTLGAALAGSIVEVMAFGGGHLHNGHLVRSRLTAGPQRLTTPGGEVLTTVGGPSGELLAAWRATGAETVVAASGLAPDNAVLRFVIPALSALLRIPPVNRFTVNRLARIPTKAQKLTRPSYAHARAEWASGEVREGWLRTGDGSDFTAAAAAEVAGRLRAGEGRPGAVTPGVLFGPELAEAAGAEFLMTGA